jgi:hypothetical protein
MRPRFDKHHYTFFARKTQSAHFAQRWGLDIPALEAANLARFGVTASQRQARRLFEVAAASILHAFGEQ